MQMESKRKLEQQSLYQTKQTLNKEDCKRLGRTLHNDPGINPKGRHNSYKYLCTQHRSTPIHKTNTNRHKRRIDSNTIIVGDFNTPLTPMDRSPKQKINKETQVLNDTLDEIDLLDIFKIFHPNAEKNTFFSSVHGTFSRIDHIVCHKSNISKFKKIENCIKHPL